MSVTPKLLSVKDIQNSPNSSQRRERGFANNFDSLIKVY